MTKSVLQIILIRLVLLASGIVLSTQGMSQEMDTLLPGMTLDSFKKVEGENKLRLRQLNGSSSNESLSVKISSNSIIWNSWGIGQTTENFKEEKSGYAFDMNTQFVDLSYTLGRLWTMTLGIGIPSGTGKITTSSNTEYKSSTISGSGYFAVFGLEIGIFEFLAGQRVNNVEYTKFESGSTVLDTKYKVSGSQSIVGLGLSF